MRFIILHFSIGPLLYDNFDNTGMIADRSIIMAMPGPMRRKGVSARFPSPVVKVRKTFPETWLWEMHGRFVENLIFRCMIHRSVYYKCVLITYLSSPSYLLNMNIEYDYGQR